MQTLFYMPDEKQKLQACILNEWLGKHNEVLQYKLWWNFTKFLS